MILLYKDLYNIKKIMEDSYELINLQNGKKFLVDELGLQIINSIDNETNENRLIADLKNRYDDLNDQDIYDYISVTC